MADGTPRLYRETHGSGPDLVMVHGWGMHSQCWGRFKDILAGRFRVTCIDLPGHGRSRMIEDWSLPGVTRALLEVAPKRAIWLGWSLGASLVIHAAATRPERLEKTVLVCGNAKFTASNEWPGMEGGLLDDFATALERDSEATLARFMALQARGVASPRALLREIRFRHGQIQQSDAGALRAGLTVLATTDLRQCLTELSCPALLLHGSGDALVPAAAGEAMGRRWATAERRVIKGAGHLPFLSHTEESAAAVFDFLAAPDQEGRALG